MPRPHGRAPRWLVHGDIKTGNVLRDDSGRIVLIPTSVPRAIGVRRAATWLSAARWPISPRRCWPAVRPRPRATCIPWACCCSSSPAAAAAGDRRYRGPAAGLRDGRRQRLPALAPHLPPRLLRLIERTLDLDRRAARWRQALADALGDLAAPRGRRVLHLGMAAVGLAFAAYVLGAFALWRPPSPRWRASRAHLHRLGPAAGAALLSGDRVAVGDRLALRLAAPKRCGPTCTTTTAAAVRRSSSPSMPRTAIRWPPVRRAGCRARACPGRLTAPPCRRNSCWCCRRSRCRRCGESGRRLAASAQAGRTQSRRPAPGRGTGNPHPAQRAIGAQCWRWHSAGRACAMWHWQLRAAVPEPRPLSPRGSGRAGTLRPLPVGLYVTRRGGEACVAGCVWCS